MGHHTHVNTVHTTGPVLDLRRGGGEGHHTHVNTVHTTGPVLDLRRGGGRHHTHVNTVHTTGPVLDLRRGGGAHCTCQLCAQHTANATHIFNSAQKHMTEVLNPRLTVLHVTHITHLQHRRHTPHLQPTLTIPRHNSYCTQGTGCI